MNSQTDDLSDEDPRVMQIAREYLADLEAGRDPDRAAYLARCPELAGELADCLDGIEMAHGAGPARPAEPQLGTLGDFLIVREIGRGGMGVVYEAIQISLNRMVALKVLPFAAALDDKQLQRFRNEAQAAAGLHHTNIIPVYAVGCERGVHYYAMQLIDGRPLDAVIRETRGAADTVEQHDATSPPTGRTRRDRESFRTVARLAAAVADALEYAHQAGIVHRDIKPANLLLDGKGNVWVADFGLAHVNDANLTRTGDVVGTLRYMSPEQASGARASVDHRADVYSLGATLYELLTLRPIFDATDRGALLNQILNSEPRPPRQIERAIPAELETVVLKAIAKDPADRYADAAALATDLNRFLSELPVLARRPSAAERVRKWLRRHPSFVGAAAMLLAFSTAVLAVAVAVVAREQARTQARAKEAEARFRLAERVVDELVQVAQEDLRDKPFTENVRKQMMETALAYHQEFIDLHKDDPDAATRLAENRARVEAILADLVDKEAMRRVDLLKEDAVLDDLRLSAEQRGEVRDLNERLRRMREPLYKEFQRLPAEERDRRFLEMARAHEAAAAEVLAPEHQLRLRQIELQRQEAEAFRRPEVASALKLTAAQRTRVRSLINDPYAGKPEPPAPNPWAAGERKRKAAYEQIVALLTAEQAARWKELTGVPYKGPMGPPFRGGKDGPKGPQRHFDKGKDRGEPDRRRLGDAL